MDTNILPTLKVDVLFQRLIRPAKKKDLAKLERSLVAEGCKSPISVWKGTIVDGHKRYEICKRRGISFATIEMPFACRESAIAWIGDDTPAQFFTHLRTSLLRDSEKHLREQYWLFARWE